MTHTISRTNRLAILAAIVGNVLIAGQALAEVKCREGKTGAGACVSPSLAKSMRQRAVVFTQPKLSHTGSPSAQSRGESQDTNSPRAIEGAYNKYGAPPSQPVQAAPGPTGPTGPTPPTGPITSDIRLKRDIVRLNCLDSGICLYRFRYIGNDTVYVGVMAQEVERIAPDAVVHGADGYLRVRYDLLGLTFQTWGEWIGPAQARSSPKVATQIARGHARALFADQR